jgi:hypothetical protein
MPTVSTIGAPTYRLAQYLAKPLGEHVEHSPRHVRNSTGFINIIKSLRAGPEDILVSFDVVSFFTMVPLGEALRLLSRHSEDDILRLFRHVRTSFFMSDGQFYEQADGMAMGSPLSPVIANFFMEHFEETALKGANHKPLCWFRCGRHLRHLAPRSRQAVEFPDHLNSVHENIQFTMETERRPSSFP